MYSVKTYKFAKKDGHTWKNCIEYSLQETINILKNKQDKYLNIRLDPSKECIAYGDIDHCPDEHTANTIFEMIASEFSVNKEDISISYCYKQQEKEYSYHWSIRSLKTDIKTLKHIFSQDKYKQFKNGSSTIVDSAPYKCSWFRLPYQTAKEKPLTHEIIQGDVEDFLLQNIPDQATEFKYQIPPKKVIPPKKKINNIDKINNNNNTNYKIVELIDVTYLTKYDTWLAIMFGMKFEGYTEEEARTISKKAPNYSDEGFTNVWNKPQDEIIISQGTLNYYAKLSNQEEYYKLVQDTEIAEKDYESVKQKMEEKYHLCKIATGEFMIYINGKWKNYSKDGIKSFLDDKLYLEFDKEKNKKKLEPLWKKWIHDENKLSYDKIVCEPHTCPKNVLNIYQPYDIYNYIKDDYIHDEEGLIMFKRLISCICNHQENTMKLVNQWIAHLILHEGEKAGICLVITGKQGTGKDSLIETIKKILGKDKVFSTTQPENHVWGRFNSLIVHSKLNHVSEVDQSNSFSFMNKIKGLLTDPQITIKAEGEKPFSISSYHNYILATNSDCPIELKELKVGQRRFSIIRTSIDLKGDNDFFQKYYEKLESKDFLLTIFYYLKNMADVPKRFTEQHIIDGLSKLQESIQTGNEDIETEFLKDFTQKNYDSNEDTLKIASSELFRMFNEYRKENYSDKYDYSQKKFTLKMKIYNLEDFKDCIKWRPTKKCNVFEMDMKSLHDIFSPKCLIEDDE